MLKGATTRFILTAVLLAASDSSAFAQGDRSANKRQSAETASQAEALFQSALVLSDKGQSELAGPRLQKAMYLWVQIREPGRAARAALQMGDRSKKARNYRHAWIIQAVARRKKTPRPGQSECLNAIAQIYAHLYVHDLAASYFKGRSTSEQG